MRYLRYTATPSEGQKGLLWTAHGAVFQFSPYDVPYGSGRLLRRVSYSERFFQTYTDLWNSCKMSREQHLKRHKEISALVRQINAKGKGGGDSVLTPAEVALAVHGYRELNMDSKRETLDKALVVDVQLREKLSDNPDKLPKADFKNEEIKKVATNLGLNASRSQAKDVRNLYTKLAELIIDDIDRTANESRETRKRQLGYYRYADKHAYNAIMVTINPALVIAISDDEGEDDDDAPEEEEEQEAPPVVEQPQEQPPPRPRPKPRPTSMIINTGRPERTVREGNMTFTFVPNTPRLPKTPTDAPKEDGSNNGPNVG